MLPAVLCMCSTGICTLECGEAGHIKQGIMLVDRCSQALEWRKAEECRLTTSGYTLVLSVFSYAWNLQVKRCMILARLDVGALGCLDMDLPCCTGTPSWQP